MINQIAGIISDTHEAVGELTASDSVLVCDKWQEETDAAFGSLRFMTGRPTLGHFKEFAECGDAAHGYDFSGDAHAKEAAFPGSLRLANAMDREDEESGWKMVLVKMTRFVRPAWEDRMLRHGEIAWIPVFYAMELFMNRECVWATDNDIDRAMTARETVAQETRERAASLLRRCRVGLLSLAPRAGMPFRRGVFNKDNARRMPCETKG